MEGFRLCAATNAPQRRVAAAPARHGMMVSRPLFAWLVLVLSLLGPLGRVAAENVTGSVGTAPPGFAPAPASGPGSGHDAGNSDGDDIVVPPDAPPSDDAAAPATGVSVSPPAGSGPSHAPVSVSPHRGGGAHARGQQQQHGRGARFTPEDEAGGVTRSDTDTKRCTDVESPPPPPRVCTSIHTQVSRAPISVECLFSVTLLRGALQRAPGDHAAQALRGRGGIENKHSTDVDSPPPPPPRVCIRGPLRTSTRPTLNELNLLLLLRASV